MQHFFIRIVHKIFAQKLGLLHNLRTQQVQLIENLLVYHFFGPFELLHFLQILRIDFGLVENHLLLDFRVDVQNLFELGDEALLLRKKEILISLPIRWSFGCSTRTASRGCRGDY